MRPRSSGALALLLLALTAPLAAPLAAQPAASQHGTVSQAVNTTDIALGFDRPSARGRTIFGDILDHDVVWTPGANRATWIEFSRDVRVQGTEVTAGRYGIWTIPHDGAPWEIILVSDWDTHHSYFPFESEVARVAATAEEGAHMEALAFYFPVVGPYEATLRLHWGDVVVPLQIEVPEG
jgi:hypothetical protein